MSTDTGFFEPVGSNSSCHIVRLSRGVVRLPHGFADAAAIGDVEAVLTSPAADGVNCSSSVRAAVPQVRGRLAPPTRRAASMYRLSASRSAPALAELRSISYSACWLGWKAGVGHSAHSATRSRE